jgi:hypothetical protein
MKKGLMILGIVVAVIAILFVWRWPWEEEYDAGELEPAQATPGMTYCQYEITEVHCETGAAYAIGDVVCLECCTGRTPPWPPRVGPNNNCWNKIDFSVKGNDCEYTAKRLNQTCTTCPANAKDMFKCPNP